MRRALPLALTLVFSNCATLRVPASIPDLGSSGFYTVIADGVSVRIKPIVGQEGYWDLFDDDLPEIGIAAAWISIHNGRQDEIHLEPRRWHLFFGARKSSLLSPKEVLDRYYEGRNIRMYSVHADLEARQLLDKIRLQRRMLLPEETTEGFIFMRIESAARAQWHRNARLVVRGAFGAGGSGKEIEVPLYADR